MKTATEQFKTVTVSVTQEDINHGIPNKCRSCPIALAIKRLFLPEIDVAVGYSGVNASTPGQTDGLTFSLPPEAVAFACEYDSVHYGQPFCFPLDIPERLVPYLNPSPGL